MRRPTEEARLLLDIDTILQRRIARSALVALLYGSVSHISTETFAEIAKMMEREEA